MLDEEVEIQEPVLEDGGHTYLSCSNCNALLVDIWHSQPKAPGQWKVKANCPWCGDSSFIKEVNGLFHVGGAGQIKEDDEDDDIPSTISDGFEPVGGVFVFKVLKANENAKPVYRP